MNPKVLIVILTHKSNPVWLFEALHSIQSQTYEDFTCVIADSSSDQGIPLRKVQSDKRFNFRRYEHQSTADVAHKVNAAAEEFGDHKYVAVMSDDDWLAPTFLEKQVAALEEDSTRAFAQGYNVIFGEHNTIWTPNPKATYRDQWIANQFAGTCVMRMEAFRSFGGYDVDAVPEGHPTGLEDFNLFLHYLRNAWTFKVIPEPLLFCRSHKEQNNRKVYGTRKFLEILQRLAPKHDCVFDIHVGEDGKEFGQVKQLKYLERETAIA